MEINEELFDPDDIPDDFDDDDDDDEGMADGSDNDQNEGSADELTEKCRITDDGDDSPEK